MTVGASGVGRIDIGEAAKPPFVRLPDLASLFASRAARLEQLAAADHPLADYLRFIAMLARAQQAALAELPPGRLPGPEQVAAAHEEQAPLLDPLAWPRDASWRVALDRMCDQLAEAALPEPARAALVQIAALDEAGLERLAERVLRQQAGPFEAAAACYVTAALQVYFARMAALLEPAQLRPLGDPCACPVCGSGALASIVHAGRGLQGTRSLCCGLCATQWHLVRIRCAQCGSTKGIAYQHIPELGAAIKAETCDECRRYTKILYRTEDPALDPIADDLATLALDLLVSEAGWDRAVPNPFLLPGGEDAAPA